MTLFNQINSGIFGKIYIRVVLSLVVLAWIAPVFGEFQKSPSDHREYLAIQLDNEMRVLLISDPETDIATASMSVKIGGGSDFDNRPGLAHFLEHMLFLGSEKYPELDGFRDFVERHGGSTNAYTSIDRTNYNFSVDPGYLQPALDRFAQYFIAPLMQAESAERERSVVDAEFQMRAQSDGARRWDVLRQVYNQKHPASKFIAGNAKTLEGEVHEDLLRFYEKFYSSNLMALVVLGQEPLEELQKFAENMFASVENSDVKDPVISEHLFEPGKLPARVTIKTLKDDPRMSLVFPVMYLLPHWKEKPAVYVSYLIGHEGEGSLLSELKNRGWAAGLYAGQGLAVYQTSTFNISITLTQDGLEHWEDVAALVFQYIRVVRQRGIDKWRYDERKMLDEIEYRFSEVTNDRRFVTNLADVLHLYPANEVYPALYLTQNYAPDLIAELMDYLVPENVLITIGTADAETDQVTPDLKVEYALAPISESTIQKWKTDVANSQNWLPSPNEFLPQDLTLEPESQADIPELVISIPRFDLWHQTDTSFENPRASFYISVRSSLPKLSAKSSELLNLYVEGVNDLLNEFAYPALMAGLSYSLYQHSRGFSIRISGYDDNQEVLLRRIIEVATSPQFIPERFEQHREDAILAIKNNNKDDAYHQTTEEVYAMVLEKYWSDEERLKVLEELTLVELELFAQEFFADEIQIVALSHGNVSRDGAVKMGEIVATGFLGLDNPIGSTSLLELDSPVEIGKGRMVIVPEKGPHYRRINVENEDWAITVFLQGSERSIEERVQFGLLAQIIGPPFFTELRTVQELGYVVHAYHMPILGIPGMVFVIQSPEVDPGTLGNTINDFLKEFPSQLSEMSDDEFEAHRDGLLSRISAKDETLTQRSGRYWREIDDKEYKFDTREQLVSELKRLDRTSFEKFVLELLVDNVASRLVIEAYDRNTDLSNLPMPEDGVLVQSRTKFKAGQEYFPEIK